MTLIHLIVNITSYAPLATLGCCRLRASFSGGASLAPEVVDFVNALGIPVNNGYGLTETAPVCASGFLGEPEKQVKGGEAPKLRRTSQYSQLTNASLNAGCGVPLPGTRCSIRSVVDETEVPDGIEGEVRACEM